MDMELYIKNMIKINRKQINYINDIKKFNLILIKTINLIFFINNSKK